MITNESIAGLIADYLAGNGLFLVDIDISRENDIVVTKESYDGSVTLDNCTAIDSIVTGHFDKDAEDYSLTVTSAGLDQPFKVAQQYIKFTGSEVEITLKKGGRIKGILSKYCDDTKSIEITLSKMVKMEGMKKKVEQKQTLLYPLSEIKECKPVIRFK